MFTKYDVDSAIDYNKLKFSDDVKIQYEEEDGFDEGLKRWNGHNIPTYSAMVSVANEEDVAVAVSSKTCKNLPPFFFFFFFLDTLTWFSIGKACARHGRRLPCDRYSPRVWHDAWLPPRRSRD